MRVLIVSQLFAPANAIGAVRVGKFAKYLVANGVDVRVLAGRSPWLPQTLPLEIDPSRVTYVEHARIGDVRFGLLDRFETRYRRGELRLSRWLLALDKIRRSILHFPDSEISWLRPALRAADRVTEDWTPDVVFSSGSPMSSLICARMIAKRLGVAWIAELRDLWLDNPYYAYGSLRRMLERRLERWTLSAAAALVTVSEPLADILRREYRKTTVIAMNGFDEDDFRAISEAAPDTQAPLTITYTGLIYPGIRDPSPLFEAVRRLGPQADSVRINFYGRSLPELRALRDKYGLGDAVGIEQAVPYREALRLQRNSDILLLLLWNSPNERGVYTGKLFEYVGAGRPILTIGYEEGVAADLIRERQLGRILNDPEEIASALREWIAEKQRTGKIQGPPAEAKAGLSRQEQFSRINALLADVVGSRLKTPTPRVTVVTSRLDIGGTERHLTRVLPALHERGIDISLYVLERGGKLEPELLTRGVRITGSEGWPAILQPLTAMIGLVRYLKRERPDIVHYFLPRPYFVGSVAAELARQGSRIMSRRSLATYRNRHPWLSRLENLLHRRTSALLGNSGAVVDQLADETGNRRKVGLIYNGIEMPDAETPAGRQAARRRVGLSDEACVIEMIANLIPYKGHADLLDALAHVKDRLPQPWTLLVIGRDSGIGPALRTKADGLGLSGNIQWLGERDDVETLLRGADIVVLASHEEGFSNALLEAMAHGIATVATAVGGNTDAIVQEESGLLVPPHAPQELGAAILRLAHDAQLRRRLGDAARQRVETRYSLDACIRRYERLYRGWTDISRKPVQDILQDENETGDRARGPMAVPERRQA